MDGFSKALKFSDPLRTADGAMRAEVPFTGLKTLWINTGTLCNIECANCYIESSPRNDRLVYINAAEAATLIDEALAMGAEEIGFTGGEPFMNPYLFAMLEHALKAGLSVLVLTNAMKPMMRPKIREQLASLIKAWPQHLTLRVSLDHFSKTAHDAERGAGSFSEALKGLRWLADEGASLSVAGRAVLNESEAAARAGYRALFADQGLPVNADDPQALVLFPEMGEAGAPPEITTACWDILDKKPDDMMCASSRMAVKRKGDVAPSVLACTLIPYNDEFALGSTLAEAAKPVKLNHPHCATFCVLGGSSCSG